MSQKQLDDQRDEVRARNRAVRLATADEAARQRELRRTRCGR